MGGVMAVAQATSDRRSAPSTRSVLAWQAASVGLVAAGWEAAVRLGLADPLFLPAPTAVGRALASTAAESVGRLGQTLLEALLGYALAVVLGIVGGLLIGATRLGHAVAMPFVVALYGIPKILILPWIALIFGVGLSTAVLSGALFAFFPVLLMMAAGVRDVDPTLITVARSMGASPLQIHRKVLVPAVLPSALAGMRIGIVFAMLGVLLAEMFAGNRGMGFQMQRLAMAFRPAELFAATALVSVLSVMVVLGLEILNRRLSRWR
jgi:NitT/TauT family transport system permease protein